MAEEKMIETTEIKNATDILRRKTDKSRMLTTWRRN